MVISLSPTFADQRWGPRAPDLFDYYQNPTRDPGGNPTWMIRHGGGMVGGTYRDYRDDSFGDVVHLLYWLNGRCTGVQPQLHWDLCAYSSGQMAHFPFFGGPEIVARSRQVYFPENVVQIQRGKATLKSMLPALGGDPAKTLDYGDSAGATGLGLAALWPPQRGFGNRSCYQFGRRDPRTYDSTSKGALLHLAQVDWRNLGGTDYIHFSNAQGWCGTRPDTSAAEWNAVLPAIKKAMSIRAYFEDGEVSTYPGFFLAYVDTLGDGAHPFGDPGLPGSDVHDELQMVDLATAIANAGKTCATQLRVPAGWNNANYPAQADAPALALYQEIDAWATNQVNAS